jgi:RNA polymerase sigma-70 factor, ECF subfamily
MSGNPVRTPPRPAAQWVEQQYDELRKLAHAQLRRERTGHTLSTTALVNEAYLRLAQQHSLGALDRSEFFAAASATMRRILVDCARTRLRAKRGGGAETVSLDVVADFLSVQEAEEFVALDEALDRLRQVNPRGADVVQYRFFAGLSLEETASALDVSAKTVQRDWLVARAWLTKEVSAAVMDLGAD